MNCDTSTFVIPLLLIAGFVLFGYCGTVIAAQTVDEGMSAEIQVTPLSGKITPIDDGKEILWIEDGTNLETWTQKSIVGFISHFQGTVLESMVLILIPIVSALLGVLCIGKFTSDKKQVNSPFPEKILAYLRKHPGSTQKQLITAMETSRGSVCYHLDKLLTAKKLQKVYAGNIPRYYPVPAPNLTEDPLEQTLRQLLSRKKSERFLRTLYEHPDATRKELAETLNVLPTTIHWYLHSYANEHIVLITKDGSEFRYALTGEAQQIYERLTQGTSKDSASQTDT